mgnify:CR=1 FL=1
MTDRLTVALRGLRFHALVGILPHEGEHAQPLELDVVARPLAGATAVLDYRALYACAADAVACQPIGYLETLAADVADRVTALGGVAHVHVAVRKPHAAIGGPLAHAEVALDRDLTGA